MHLMYLLLLQACAAAPLDIGSEKQLFIDTQFFETSENIALQVNPAFKTEEHNLQADRPWENATLNWFNVMADEDMYRMWYECYDVPGWPTDDDTSFCYAESKDGIHWTKPELGLFSYQDSTKNNILFRKVGPEDAHSRVHGTGIFKDPSAPPEARYKAVAQGSFFAEEPYPISWGSGKSYLNVAGMASPDGIHWTRYPKSILHEFADSQYSCFWDDRLNSYVLYGRASGRGRALGRAESKDFTQFGKLELVLEADGETPANSDLYNSAALKYPYAEGVHFMFPSLYQHGPDTIDIRLAVSRDGIHWSWPDQNVPFIPLGEPGAFDSGTLYIGQGLVRAGDELWQYYGGSPLPHNYEGGLETLTKPGNGRIYSRVVSRLDGFVSADADAAGGSFVTPPLTYTGNTLRLNVQVRDGGSVRVGLLDETGSPVPGRSVAECVPITGDHINTPVTWNSGGDVGERGGQPTKIRVEMADASLYSFQFVASPSAASSEAEASDVAVKILRTVTVFEAEEDLNFPWVFRGPGDFLSLGCSIGKHTKTERGMYLASDDGGDTWAVPNPRPVGGMGTLLRDGRAVVLSCWGPEANAEGAYPVKTLFYNEGGRVAAETVPGVMTLPFAMKPHFHRSIVELPDGSLVATIYGTRDGDQKYTSALMHTTDAGKHWTFRSVIAHSETVGKEGFCEPALVRLANGDLFCALRVGGPLHTTRSADNGQTWSPPEVVADHGVDPALLLLGNGVLVLSYGRPNVDLIFSADGTGRTWGAPFSLYRGPGCSYTSLVEGSNGDLLAFFSQSGFVGNPGPGPLNMIRLARLSVTRE